MSHAAERPDSARPSAEMIDRLNAYLDGELDGEERSDLERQLAGDERLQTEFRKLQRAWDLLDSLPRSDVGTNFTQSTVEMIAFDVADELTAVQTATPGRSAVDWLLLAGGATVAAVAGFLLIEAVRPHKDEALLHDLPVIEQLDLYGRTEHATTAEFLRTMRDQKLLTTPTPTSNHDPRR